MLIFGWMCSYPLKNLHQFVKEAQRIACFLTFLVKVNEKNYTFNLFIASVGSEIKLSAARTETDDSSNN